MSFLISLTSFSLSTLVPHPLALSQAIGSSLRWLDRASTCLRAHSGKTFKGSLALPENTSQYGTHAPPNEPTGHQLGTKNLRGSLQGYFHAIFFYFASIVSWTYCGHTCVPIWTVLNRQLDSNSVYFPAKWTTALRIWPRNWREP